MKGDLIIFSCLIFRSFDSWSTSSKSKLIKLTENNLCAKNTSGSDSGLLKATKPMRPSLKEAAYFEIKIHSSGEGWVSIGLAAEDVSAENNYPGKAKRSYGYFSYNGDKRCNMESLTKYGPNYTQGDIIGCGLTVDAECFFTLNGTHLGTAFEIEDQDFKEGLYPCIGFYNAGYSIGDMWKAKANFGQEPFLFDLHSLE